MGRERLMQQQRARMMKRRARLKKKKADIKKYGSGGKPAVTRDTSKDVSRQVLKYGSGAKKGVTRNTSLDKKPPKAVTPKASTPKKQMPGGSTRAEVEKSFNKAKAINNFVGPGGSRTRADLKRSESEYNKSKAKKPVRSNFPSGRAGAAEYAKAMREYRKAQRSMLSKKPKPKTNRRGRRI